MNIQSKAILAYVIIFLLGGASGFFLNKAISSRFPGANIERGPEMNRDFPPQFDGEIPQRMRNFIINQLDLQEDQIEPFFEVQSEHLQTFFSRMKEYKEEEGEILRELHSEFVEDVDEILNEEQIRELISFTHPDSIHQRRIQRRRGQRRFW